MTYLFEANKCLVDSCKSHLFALLVNGFKIPESDKDVEGNYR